MNTDELFELDNEAFEFLTECAGENGCDTEDNEFLNYCLSEGILQTEKPDIKRLPVSKSPEPSLRYLELQITKKCNLRCKHCYIGPPADTELSLQDIKRTLDEFQEIQGLRLLITGGEPVMHTQFNEINALLPDYAMRKILFTNGTLITERLLEELNVDEIQVSVDGIGDSHDALRGKDSFKKAIRCIKLALDKGFDVSVSTMVHSENLDDFDEMKEMFKIMGIKGWTVDIPCLEGNLKENTSFHLSPEKAGKYLRYGFGAGLHGGGEGFACGLHLMSVTAEGNCAKCTFYSEEPVGHISEGLAQCWQRIRHIRLEELDCDCDELDICRGGCRYRAEHLLGKDLYKCVLYDKIKI
jgi:radical SAM protein with 4Fe4S-binding SPASM domain